MQKREDFLLIFLHGFLGNSHDWVDIINSNLNHYKSLAIDLPGHGKFSVMDDKEIYTEEFLLNYLNSIIKPFGSKKIILIGYSLGARAALSFACNYPQLVHALVLESGTAGIKDKNERDKRIEQDNILVNKIKNNYNNFIKDWYNSPIFYSLNQNNKLKELLINKRSNNNVNEVSKLLIGFSQGIMTPIWDNLINLSFPVLLITGELDIKYTEINKRMSNLLQNSEHVVIKEAGHIPHFENKEVFINKLDIFLETL